MFQAEGLHCRFGSWMGGDRDGNPFVTPETTRDVVITARLSAINLYFTDIEQLMFELSNWRCSKEMRVSPSRVRRFFRHKSLPPSP